MAVNVYQVGDPVVLTFTWDVAGAPTNPNSVTVYVGKPGELVGTAYTTSNGLVYTAPSTYTLTLTVDNTPGPWLYQAVGTGVRVTPPAYFTVQQPEPARPG